MNLLTSLIAVIVVMLMVSASARIVQDATLAASQWADRQLARQRAESLLRRALPALTGDGKAGVTEVQIETLPTAEPAEIGDLPLLTHRVTATAQGRHTMVTLQADVAIDGCEHEDEHEDEDEHEHDAPCQPRIRPLAWRELGAD